MTDKKAEVAETPDEDPRDMTQEAPEESPAEYHIRKYLESLGFDPSEDEHMEDTPRRIVESRREELFRGLKEDPSKYLETTFSDIEQYEGDAGWVIEKGIQVQSMCAHHFLPFRGEAYVGYIPRTEAVGLSKLARVVNGYARRPQVQERLTNQIATTIHEELDTHSTIVVIEAEHECMSLRGVQEPHTTTITSALRGAARDEPHIKEEFMDLVGKKL